MEKRIGYIINVMDYPPHNWDDYTPEKRKQWHDLVVGDIIYKLERDGYMPNIVEVYEEDE